jgi:hypothetical protein
VVNQPAAPAGQAPAHRRVPVGCAWPSPGVGWDAHDLVAVVDAKRLAAECGGEVEAYRCTAVQRKPRRGAPLRSRSTVDVLSAPTIKGHAAMPVLVAAWPRHTEELSVRLSA